MLKDIIAISKLPGLFQIMKRRNDGLIVKSLLDEKQTFVSSRANVFTPLENITMYTTEEPKELVEILAEMKKQLAKNPPVDSKADGNTLRKYFGTIVPNFDDERVYNSDISKLIKWFALLDSKGLVSEEVKRETAVEEAEEKPKKKAAAKKEEVIEEAPKAEKSKAKKVKEEKADAEVEEKPKKKAAAKKEDTTEKKTKK